MTYIPASTRLIPVVQYETPATGATITVGSAGYIRLIVNPSGSLLALTIAFPGSPSNGDRVEVAASQVVTTLTLSGGTLIGALTSLAVGGFAAYVYSSSASKWFRCG